MPLAIEPPHHRIWLRNEYTFNLDLAERSIRKVNESLAMVASDRLLSRHFGDIRSALNPRTVGERVVLLDGLWGTRLYTQAGAPDCIAESLAKNSALLIELCEGIDATALEATPHRVVWASTVALPLILELRDSAGKPLRRNYSFAAKFLHWTTRLHFPIVDSKARRTINTLQDLNGVSRNHMVRKYADAKSIQDDYRRWICFYSDLVHGLSSFERERLLRVDYDSQHPTYRVKHSLLRVLDKVFYRLGGGSGQGRANP